MNPYAGIEQTNFGEQKEIKLGKFTLVMFPEGYIALQHEIATGLHPKLEPLLAGHQQKDWEIMVTEIATYCSVVMDGSYTAAELDKLCYILAGRLEVLRESPQGIILHS